MPRSLSRGEQAAARAVVARRGELGLSQKQLAERSGVSERAIGNFERMLVWPRAKQLGQLERLGLNWYVGYLRELADDVDAQDEGSHRYQTRAKAARIRELEAQKALIDAELEELGGDTP